MNKKMFFLKNESLDKLSSVWPTPKEQNETFQEMAETRREQQRYNRQIHNLYMYGEFDNIGDEKPEFVY
jgi:hypothetical protein